MIGVMRPTLTFLAAAAPPSLSWMEQTAMAGRRHFTVGNARDAERLSASALSEMPDHPAQVRRKNQAVAASRASGREGEGMDMVH